MRLRNLLTEKRSAILKKWCDGILESYPADTSTFLKNNQNQFANPVGHTIRRGTEAMFDAILQGTDFDKVFPFLDEIIKIRAIQDFTPSQAVSFILSLKKIIREELASNAPGASTSGELPEFDDRIDSLALASFDMYMKYRERLCNLKANESRRLTFRLLQRANLLCETGEQDTELATGN